MVSGSYNSEPLHEPGVFAGVSPAGFLEDTRYGSRTDHTLSDYHSKSGGTEWSRLNGVIVCSDTSNGVFPSNTFEFGIYTNYLSRPDHEADDVGSRH
jgi:hypothetical protein